MEKDKSKKYLDTKNKNIISNTIKALLKLYLNLMFLTDQNFQGSFSYADVQEK